MVSENIWKQDIVLQERDADYRGLWKPQAILAIMQEMSGYHSTHLGFGRPKMVTHGMVWVLSRLRLEMLAYPKVGDPLEIHTWAAPVETLFFPRYFEFYQGGNLVGHANTMWVLMDIRKRKLLRPSAMEEDIPIGKPSRPFGIPSPGRIALPKDLPICAERKVTYSDLDLNGHMNNAQYAAWTCDFFQEQTLAGYCLSSFQVTFVAEALPGEEILLQGALQENAYYLQGNRDGHRIFEICGTFEKVEASGFDESLGTGTH